MSITDAEFAAWTRADTRRAVLCEIAFAYESGGAQAEGTVYLSTVPYSTDFADSPPNVAYHSVIEKAPEFERRIDLGTLGGRGLSSVSSLQLYAADGSMDFLLDLIVDGREARFYLGDPSWPRADFRLVFVAVVGRLKAAEDIITVELRDKTYLLDATVIGEAIATGPNAGRPKPILLGRVKNFDVTPYLLDSANLIYYVSDFALDATFGATLFPTVRDAGVDLLDADLFFMDSGSTTADAGTDTITQVGHGLAVNDVVVFTGGGGSLFAGLSSGTQYWVISAGLTADNFRLSLTRGGSAVNITGTVITGSWACNRRRYYCDASVGTIELSSSPVGRVTIDLAVVDAAGFFSTVARLHDAFEWLVSNYGEVATGDLDTDSIDALSTLEAAESALYGRAVLDRTNLLQLLDEIAATSRSWYAWNAAGVLTVGRFDLANVAAVTPVAEIFSGEVIGKVACENLALKHGKVILDARRNVVVQTDGLADTVSAEDKSKWSQSFQTRVSTTDPATATYLANWWDYHKSAIDSRPFESVLDSGGQVACDAITDLFRPWTRVVRLSVGLDRYALDPGDCVRLTYPRFGFEDGVSCRVAGVKTSLTDERVELTLVAQIVPDYTTAAYP